MSVNIVKRLKSFRISKLIDMPYIMLLVNSVKPVYYMIMVP